MRTGLHGCSWAGFFFTGLNLVRSFVQHLSPKGPTPRLSDQEVKRTAPHQPAPCDHWRFLYNQQAAGRLHGCYITVDRG